MSRCAYVCEYANAFECVYMRVCVWGCACACVGGSAYVCASKHHPRFVNDVNISKI